MCIMAAFDHVSCRTGAFRMKDPNSDYPAFAGRLCDYKKAGATSRGYSCAAAKLVPEVSDSAGI